MSKAYLSLMKHALDAGYTLEVDDGEETFTGLKYKQAKDVIENVEEARLNIINADDKIIAWAYILPYGVGDDESVADWSVPADDNLPQDDPSWFVERWFNDTQL